MANETIPDLTAGTPPYAAGTLVELAVPDGLGGFVSRKGLLPDLTGAIPLASGTITDPVAYLDLALPAWYSQFKLLFTNLAFSQVALLAMAMSTDGGVTFINDTENYDSYFNTYIGVVGRLNNTPPAAPYVYLIADALVYLADTGSGYIAPPLGQGVCSIDLYPGSDTTLGNLVVVAANYSFDMQFDLATEWNGLNPEAVVAPVPARINAIRIQPYGNGTANPPTSGQTFTCSYFLLGVPTP